MIEYILITESEKFEMRQFAINGLEYTLQDLQIMLNSETDLFKVQIIQNLINDKQLQIDTIKSIN